jgi:hypothetical protein
MNTFTGPLADAKTGPAISATEQILRAKVPIDVNFRNIMVILLADSLTRDLSPIRGSVAPDDNLLSVTVVPQQFYDSRGSIAGAGKTERRAC